MPLARTGVLVGLFIGLIAVTLQNQTPALSLIFLGMRSQPLPLGIWIVGAIVLGIFTGLILLFLLNGTNTGPRPTARRPRTPRQPPASRPSSTAAPDWSARPSNDWGASDGDSEWGARPAASSPTPKPSLDDFSSVDEQRYARAGGTAPSTYSRSAQDPTFVSQPGQRESVFEAEYRMVKPPGQEPPQPENWDELNDDFFEKD